MSPEYYVSISVGDETIPQLLVILKEAFNATNVRARKFQSSWGIWSNHENYKGFYAFLRVVKKFDIEINGYSGDDLEEIWMNS